jgi:hypothetical protein
MGDAALDVDLFEQPAEKRVLQHLRHGCEAHHGAWERFAEIR